MSLKLLVNNPDVWNSFERELEEELTKIHTKMEQTSEASDLYRLQGEAKVIRRLKKLRDKVNNG